ncbi:hypothetical protein Pmani_033640 [Petrolisthes manimaculis]|uniref:Uncharacterized protein n=1 Tax=Petrolisthes manimaculis TaxID=1843537 RepID=A0AAE1NR57_9EUCA|nr:hypothetical protein Pmani_033640 [Petrolisthes manimaculis]
MASFVLLLITVMVMVVKGQQQQQQQPQQQQQQLYQQQQPQPQPQPQQHEVLLLQDDAQGPLLSTFTHPESHLSRSTDGSYSFSFSLPHQQRSEQRDAFGRVTGNFAFVDKEGEEVAVHYDADQLGFRPQSDILPKQPQETPDVQRARAEFMRHYEETAKLLGVYDDSESEESSSEESDEDGESDEDEDSSSSSEEDSDSDSDDDEDSDEDEEEEEEGEKEEQQIGLFRYRFGQRTQLIDEEENENEEEDEAEEGEEEEGNEEEDEEEREIIRSFQQGQSSIIQAIPVSLQQGIGGRHFFTPFNNNNNDNNDNNNNNNDNNNNNNNNNHNNQQNTQTFLDDNDFRRNQRNAPRYSYFWRQN